MLTFNQFLTEEQTFHVYIHKSYFPSKPGTKPGDEAYEKWNVTAASRDDAAKKIWQQHGLRLLKLMKPSLTKLPRKVSLFVSSPKTNAGRLPPILVYTGTPAPYKADDGAQIW
jgi:hypothetical protein